MRENFTKAFAFVKADLKDGLFIPNETIYLESFWVPHYCDHLASGVDYFVFDSVVVAGTHAASCWVASSVGCDPTGHLSQETLELVVAAKPSELLSDLERLRRAYYRSLKSSAFEARRQTNTINQAKKRAMGMLREDDLVVAR